MSTRQINTHTHNILLIIFIIKVAGIKDFLENLFRLILSQKIVEI